MSAILFKNTLKFNQKNCEKVDVVIVEHKQDDCLEIIAYNPILAQEAERIYLNYKMLKVKFDNSSPNSRLRIFESSKMASISGKVQTLNVAHYLTTRLSVPALVNSCFVIHLIATEFDTTQDDKRLDIEFDSKPDNVTPYKTQNMNSQRYHQPANKHIYSVKFSFVSLQLRQRGWRDDSGQSHHRQLRLAGQCGSEQVPQVLLSSGTRGRRIRGSGHQLDLLSPP
jgi:hypothetical protein